MGSGFTMSLPTRADLIVPFFKTVSYPLGVLGFVALTWAVIVGTSNAVNLTDGLDGLAIMPTVMVGSALGIFAYVVGRVDYSKYLLFPYIPGASELMVLCAAIGGAGLAFLWFNAYPAQVFMGDVGALALGGALGTIAVIVRQEIVLFIMGGVFVVETLSAVSYTHLGRGRPHRRDPGAGQRADLRSEQARDLPRRQPAQPGHHRHVRARLDHEALHRRAGAGPGPHHHLDPCLLYTSRCV